MITVMGSTEITRNWWVLGLRAAAGIVLGVIALVTPGVTLAALVTLFAVYALADGILAIIAAVRGVSRRQRWGSMLVEGIFGIAAGLLALLYPGIGALALTWLVAAWALSTGVFEVMAAIQLRRTIAGEWLLLLAGILSIVLAVLIALFPGVGVVLLVVWVGAYALVYGLVTLALAIRVKHWTQLHA